MPERAKQALEKAKQTILKLKNLNKKQKIGLIAAAVLIAVLITVLVVRNTTRPYALLYSDLSTEDLAAVASFLDTAGVKDFQIRNNDTVYVREGQENTLRAQMVMQGIPSTGYAYGTYLDNVGALSSQSDRKQLVLYDLQERLGRDIRAFDGVKDASVYLTEGEDQRYILGQNVIQAKAGVKVTMQSGKELTRDQVSAIQRLVSNAMQGVEIENVTVEDGMGNRYTSGDDSALSEIAKYKMDLEEKVNEQVRNSIMKVLVPIFGPDNVEVSVHSTVDVSRTYKDSTIYELPEYAQDGSTDGRGILGSEVWDDGLIRDQDQAPGGVVGTANNAEINEYFTETGTVQGNESELHRSGEKEYRTTQHNVQTDQPPGTITDLSVAIAVNSTYGVITDPTRFIHLAATAAGIGADVEADKIAIVSYPFYSEELGPDGLPVADDTILGLPAWVVYAAIAGIALFLALLLVLLLLRDKKNKQRMEEERIAAEAAAAAAAAAAEEAEQGADIMDIQAEQMIQMRSDIRQFVENNPLIAAQMLKNWLHGVDDRV